MYLETVRQRSERVHQSSAELFPAANQQKVLQAKPKTVQPAKKSTPQAKPFKKPATPDLDHEPPAADDGPGLPSVRKLLAQFEGGAATGPGKAVGRPTVGRLQANLARQHVEPAKSENLNVKKSDPQPVRDKPKVVSQVAKTSSQAQVRSSTSHGDEEGKVLGPNWDPLACVQSLYKVESVVGQDDEVSLDSQASPSIEGYMERLPAGRKKSTMWNSWKRQYFIAKNGVLNIFEDKTQGEFLGKFELFGGNIDFMDSNMLGIQDR